MQPIQEIYPQLATPRTIAITTHQKPDADAMGSSQALRLFLESFGHTVYVVSPTNWARWLNWMPGVENVIDYESDKIKGDELLSKADWLFCLDFNRLDRTKTMAPFIEGLKCTKILIDHHQEPDTAAFEYGMSSTAKSSTCEMVYDFITDSGHRSRITKSIAECIYAGVVADTGSFRFASTHAAVHHLVAYLKEQGLEHSKVHEQLYDNNLENRLRFLGHVLSNRMEILYQHNTALIHIPKMDLLRFNVKTGDTEGLVNYPLSIQGIKLAAICIDRDEERKWSFRSKGDFDCNTFARNYFNGGGHYNASGGRDSASLQETVTRFRNIITQLKNLH